MSGKNDIVAGIRLDGEKEFKNAAADINKSVKTMQSEMNLLKAEYDGQQNSLEALTKKHDLLNRILVEQKNKVSATERGLEQARTSYSNVGKGIEDLRNELEKANRELKELEQTHGEASEEAVKQKKVVDKLTDAIAVGEENYRRAGNRVKDWEKQLNNANAQVKKTNSEINKNAVYLKEAEDATDHCAKSIDEFGKTLEKVDTDTFWDSFKANVASRGVDIALDLVKNGVEAIGDTMKDTSAASAQLAASTGLSEAAAKRYQSVMYQIKGDNYGEDYRDVADAMSEIIQIMGELSDDSMVEVTESAMALRDTFGMDINESIRAVDVMMKTMGIDATKAFDLITKGAQNGLNRSGELVDNITEYGQIWAQAGFSAEEMFAILENGLDAGAYNLDKVNDYVKEFGNSLADGRIEKNLGYFSDESKELFEKWKTGGVDTSDVFYSIIDDLSRMTNKQEALTVASEVWSALGEDNALSVLTALNKVNTGYQNVQGSMDALKETKFSDLESAVSGLGAAVQEKIVTPIVDVATPAVTGILETVTAAVSGIGEAADPVKEELDGIVEGISSANDELETAIANRNNTVANATLEASKMEALGQRLIELSSAEESSATTKAEIQQIIEKLSQTIPELASAYDAETGSLKMSTEEVRNYIDAQKEAYLTQATLAANQELINSLVSAQTEYRKYSEEVQNLQNQNDVYERQIEEVNRLSDAYAETTISEQEYRDGLMGIALQYEEFLKTGKVSINTLAADLNKLKIANEESIATATAKQEKFKKNLDEGTRSIKEQTQSVMELSDLFQLDFQNGETTETLKKTAVEMKTVGEKAEELALKLDPVNGAFVMAAEGATEMSEASKEAADTSEEAAERMAQAAKDGANAQSTALQSMRDLYYSTVEEIENDIRQKINPFDKFDGGTDMTVEAMLENLKTQSEGLEKYQENLQTITDTMGDKIAPEFLQYIKDMGTDGANMLEHMVLTLEQSNGVELLQQMSAEYMSALNMSEEIAEAGAANKLAYQAAMGELGSTDAEFTNLSNAINSAIETAVSDSESAWSGLSEETQAALEGAVRTAKECGVEIPEGLIDGITSGEVSPESALEQLNGSIKGTLGGLAEIAKKAGVEIAPELAAGIEEGGQGAIDAFGQLIQGLKEKVPEVAEGMDEESGSFQQAGSNAASEYTEGIENGTKEAVIAAGELAKQSRSAVASWESSFYSAGYNLATGVADGISAGKYGAIKAATQMVREALNAAKSEAEIRSPSRKFKREVGEQIGKGTAFGIKDSASIAGKEAARMSEKVYQKATAWLSKYKKKKNVTAEEERYFWEQIVKHTKEGTNAYNKALKKSLISNSFGVSKTTTTGSGKDKKTATKDAESYYSDVLNAAETYYNQSETLRQRSVKEELAYWENVQKQLKEGTDAWYDAQQKINSVKEKIGTVDNASDLLSAYQTYYEMSEKAEMDYWDIIRKQYQTGTEERLEADGKYLDAKEKYYDRLNEIKEDYARKEKDIDKELQDSIDKLNEKYEDSVKGRAEEIRNSFGLFDEFTSESATGKELLFNIKSQAAGYEDWSSQIDLLAGKGILNESLMEELKEQGPEISAQLHALNSLTEEELKEYNEAYLKKMELSDKQAEEDNEKLRAEISDQTAELNAQAEKDKAELKAQRDTEIASINTNLNTELSNLAGNIKTIAGDQTAALVAAIAGQQVKQSAAGSTTGSITGSATGSTAGNTSGAAMAVQSTAQSKLAGVAIQALQAASIGAGNSEKQAIMEIINSGSKKNKVTDKDKSKHSNLWEYIAEKYKRSISNNEVKELADILGISTGNVPTAKQKNKILKKLKEKGYRTGGRILKDDLIWKDEDGTEMIIRKSDNASLKPVRAGDLIVNAADTQRLARWSQYDPDSTIAKLREQSTANQAKLQSMINDLHISAGIAKLNNLMDTGAARIQPVVNNGAAEDILKRMENLMSQFLPYLAQGNQIVLDSGELVGATFKKTGRELAASSRRHRG